jgi:hypothetical protein
VGVGLYSIIGVGNTVTALQCYSSKPHYSTVQVSYRYYTMQSINMVYSTVRTVLIYCMYYYHYYIIRPININTVNSTVQYGPYLVHQQATA